MICEEEAPDRLDGKKAILCLMEFFKVVTAINWEVSIHPRSATSSSV